MLKSCHTSRSLPVGAMLLSMAITLAPSRANAQDGRQLAGTITVDGVDHENVGANETVHRVFKINVQLTKAKSDIDLKIDHVKWGGECRVESDIKATLLADNRIKLTGTIKLFEGDNEDTGDLEDTEKVDIVITKGGKLVEAKIEARNEGLGGGDSATVSFALTNSVVEDE